MSDEPEPPAFSLRPRKKPDDDQSGKGSDAASPPPKLSLKPEAPAEPPASPAAEARPRLSLKPKTQIPPPAESPVPPPAEPAAASPRAKPRLAFLAEPAAKPPAETAAPAPTSEASPASATEHRDETNPSIDPAVRAALQQAKVPKPKLKLTVAKAPEPAEPPPITASPTAEPQQSSGFVGDGSPPPALALLPLDEPAVDSSMPPPIPVVTDNRGNAATTPSLPAAVQSVANDDDDDEEDETEAPARKRLRPEQRPIFKVAVALVVLLLLGAVGGGGYMVYTLFFVSPDLNPYAAPLEAVIEAPAPPPPAAPGPASVAGQLIEKAQDAVVAHEEVVEAIDQVSEDAPAAAEDVLAAEAVAASADASDEPTVPVPSGAFRDWVNNVVISGVAETSTPRAFINGVLVKQGDTVNHGLGIVFDGIDAVENLVIFMDGSGAVLGKRY